MSKIIAFMMLLAALMFALAGCEGKDPHEPDLKGKPNPNYPRPGVSMGGGPPPSSGGEQKGGEEKGGAPNEGEKKEEGKGSGASAGAG